MNLTRKILNIIALVLVVLQIIGYLGSKDAKPIEAKGVDKVYFYIGFNLPFLLACILFIIALSLKRSIAKKEADDEIDSIGQN